MASCATKCALLGFVLLAGTVSFAAERLDQVVGFYSDGALRSPVAISAQGHGYVHLFRVRNHYWGSTGLVELIESVSSQIANEYPDGERLQVGDLSGRSGGRIPRHVSHQNGLDVDFVYFRVNRREQRDDPERGFTENFTAGGRLSRNFDIERNWRLFELLVDSGRVQRIFVDQLIKRQYCRKYWRSIGAEEVLRRLRPYPNHGDHMHIRLACPAESPACISQEEVPPGSGC